MENKKTQQNSGSQEKKKPHIKQWIYAILAIAFCIWFVFWTGYWAVLIFIPIIIDIYITRFISWGAWRNAKNPLVRSILGWVDAIVFALVGVWFINTFFFQNYQIPSSSLEKTLLVGDFLCVSKVSYGARSPMTPFSLPLMQHTFPVFGFKSYLENPQLEYKRFKGTGTVERNDIVVFNYPSGDSVATRIQDRDYYVLCKEAGEGNLKAGREILWSKRDIYGEIVYRPVDRRENYVKRCIGLPGETISIKNDTVYINNKRIESPKEMQLAYVVQTDGTYISDNVLTDELRISIEDQMKIRASDISGADSTILAQIGLNPKFSNTSILYNWVFLTKDKVELLEKKPFVLKVLRQNEYLNNEDKRQNIERIQESVYPITYNQPCPYGDFPSLWIPAKGTTIKFDTDVEYKVAAYGRCIKNYELNDLDYKGGKVYINGKQADSYTFNLDYYFMMGDNRDNSADSRVWGFVPEDHIVGKPLFIWLSLNPDKGWFEGKIRWSRIFTAGNKK